MRGGGRGEKKETRITMKEKSERKRERGGVGKEERKEGKKIRKKE